MNTNRIIIAGLLFCIALMIATAVLLDTYIYRQLTYEQRSATATAVYLKVWEDIDRGLSK